MVSSHFRRSVAQGYLFLANILNTAKIEKLVVPDVVQTGSTDVVLDCQFAVPDTPFTLQWWLRAGRSASSLVYEWTPPSPPRTVGILEGRLDLSYRVSSSPNEEYRGIRLRRVDPQLSGEYSCVVIHDGMLAREVKRMLVYSPEVEFEMNIKRKNDNFHTAEITCYARGVYPQPDLILEYEKEPIAQQVQRVWHTNNMLQYDAESKCHLSATECGERLEVTCRLHLPQADYTAIKKKLFSFDEKCNNRGRKKAPMQLFSVLLLQLSLFNDFLSL